MEALHNGGDFISKETKDCTSAEKSDITAIKMPSTGGGGGEGNPSKYLTIDGSNNFIFSV